MPSYTNVQEGYRALKSCADANREAVCSDLACGKQILAVDEIWPHIEANWIDEDIALKHLANVLDITTAFGLLPEHLQTVNEHLFSVGY